MSFSLLFHHVRECTHDSIASLCSGIGIEDLNKKVRTEKNLLFKRKNHDLFINILNRNFKLYFFPNRYCYLGISETLVTENRTSDGTKYVTARAYITQILGVMKLTKITGTNRG